MLSNRYTKALDEIKAPAEAVEKARQAAKKQETAKTSSLGNWKKVFVTACLAAVMITALFLSLNLSGKKAEHAFSVIVSAAEIDDHGFTSLGTIKTVGGKVGKNEAGFFCGEEFNFDFLCLGEGITQVTYSIENASFRFSEKFAAEDKEYYSLPNAKGSSFTVRYGENSEKIQNGDYDFGLRICTLLSETDEFLSETERRALCDYCSSFPSVGGGIVPEGFDRIKCLKTVYDAMLKRVRVKINVCFEDGSSQSKTMIFCCDSIDQNGVTVCSAKLVS